MDIQVDLSDRQLTAGTTSITLSNYQIRYLRAMTDGPFTEETAAEAVEDLIEHQIKPFLEDTRRTPTEANIEQEIEEAFTTHLYNHIEPE